MHPDEHLDALKREAASFATALDGVDLANTRVPSCPDWSLEDLTLHLGRIQRWVTGIVRDRPADRPPFPPRPDAVTKAWFEEGADALIDAFTNADPTAPAYNFIGAKEGVRFWFRRQAQETAIHRCDAQLARDVQEPIETELAVDGIDELLDHFLPFTRKEGADLGGTVHLHATDSPHGEWLVRCVNGNLEVGHGHEKGDAAVRGTASDLLLWLWGRTPNGGIDALEIFGDAELVSRWHDILPSP